MKSSLIRMAPLKGIFSGYGSSPRPKLMPEYRGEVLRLGHCFNRLKLLPIFVFLLIATTARAQTITHVGSAVAQNLSGTHDTTLSTGPINVSAGQYAIVQTAGPWGIGVTTPTDSGGNTCSPLSATFYTGESAGNSLFLSACPITNSKSGDVFTCNFPGGTPFVACTVDVYSDGGVPWFLDVGGATGAVSPTPQSGTSISLGTMTLTTDSSTEVVHCGVSYAGSLTSVSAGTIGTNAASLGAASGGATSFMGSEYYVASSVLSAVGATMTLGASKTAAGITCMSLSSAPLNPPYLTVNAATVRHAISPLIYGLVGANTETEPSFAASIQLPFFRQGGDGASRYNWSLDSTCDGGDYWFICAIADGGTPGAGTAGNWIDNMISTYRGVVAGSQPLVTIPVLPYIANTQTYLASYPTVSVAGGPSYSGQTATYAAPLGPYAANGFGNGISGSGNIVDTDVTYNMVANSTTTQGAWLAHLIAKWGMCASGGVCYYQLDNEPSGWSNTHRDVEPHNVDYAVIEGLDETYANLIHTYDSGAKISGPTDFYPYGLVGLCSLCGTGSYPQFAPEYWLYKMHADGVPVTHFDEHWYCNPTSDSAELQSPREFWDPTFLDGGPLEAQTYFNGPVQLLPRYQSWIASYDPGLKVGISEWGCEANTNPLVDTLTDADILGVFGYQGVDFADEWWSVVGQYPQLQYSFLLYRNYDGAGGQFGNMSVSSASTEPTEASLTVYGALRSSDGKLTVMVINKTLSAINTTLTISGFTATPTADVYTYSSASLASIVHTTTGVSGGGLTSYSFPSYSATLFVFTPTTVGCMPPTGLTATVETTP